MSASVTPILDQVAADAAFHWALLAASEDGLADWYEANGLPLGDVSYYRHRARTYRRTAETLRREAVTGKAHCSACGGDHPNHHHPSLPSGCGCRCGLAGCLWCKP